jgi:hypothetical protein
MQKQEIKISPTISISLTTPLFIVFLVLKMMGYIDWPWIWICAPLWVPLAMFFGILAAIALFGLIAVVTAAIISAVMK